MVSRQAASVFGLRRDYEKTTKAAAEPCLGCTVAACNLPERGLPAAWRGTSRCGDGVIAEMSLLVCGRYVQAIKAARGMGRRRDLRHVGVGRAAVGGPDAHSGAAPLPR